MADEFHYYYNKELDKETNKKINLEIVNYAGIYILKKMDISDDSGGHVFEVPLSGIDEHLEPVMDDLLFNDLVKIDTVNICYKISDKGRDYIDSLIDEIEGYIDRYEDFDPQAKVNLMKRDRVNPLRVRFLWGLYDGEFDDFNQWQDNLGITDKIKDWQTIIVKKEFYDILFEEIDNMENMDDEELNDILKEAEDEKSIERNKKNSNINITRIGGNGTGY